MIAAEQKYPTHEHELRAVVEALRHWRCYLEGCDRFLISTDHDTLKHFMKQQHLSARHTHWLEDISPYANNMDIFYRRGETNRADGLSRKPDLDLSIAALQEYEKQYREQEYLMAVQEVAVFAGPTAEFVQQIREGYNRDPHFKGLTTGLRVEDGLYYMGDRLAVPEYGNLRHDLLHHYHEELGHYGQYIILAHLKEHYYWPGMKQQVNDYVAACPTCQMVKGSTQKPAGTLSPLPVPTRPWEMFSLDLIVQLSLSEQYDAIVTFTHLYSKMVHIAPTTVIKVTTEELARIYMCMRYTGTMDCQKL
jgi:hypothetical protein